MTTPLIFLLSPAHCGGKRAALLTRDEAAFDLAVRFRSPYGAPLGEVFSFLSGLYFRGKLAYSERFARPTATAPGTLVITSSRGVVSPQTPLTPMLLDEFARTPIDLREPAYLEPLVASVSTLNAELPSHSHFVLLGSVASNKYVHPLLDLLGERLLFPPAFAGMGDMQRGSLLLRAAAEESELEYRPVAGAILSRAGRASRRRE